MTHGAWFGLLGLVLINGLALVLLLAAGPRRPSRARAGGDVPGEAGEDRALRGSRGGEDVLLRELIEEVERKEARARRESPAEARLASEIARWRARTSGGSAVPTGAEPCRPASSLGNRVA